ncbi:RHS family protein, partial [Prevotella sp. oral taxon 306 str. F0472]|uniref:RHS repeat-associated core domain-containing protein n=1 Tax=Prevotella sp. oral taxon 306 TaxID=712461 RepID=UPI00025BCE57
AYYYGRQGEVTKTVRTVMASVADIRTYVYGATYDSWNRVQTMTYPDGEVVTYHYNAAGQVESLTSNKQGRQSVIVDRIGYDKEGHTVYTKLGNGTETTYTYDKQRERLQVMNLTADGQAVMENRYQYDAVDNILGITNAANPTSLTKLNKAKLGGKSMHTYEYDELNRLIHASGKAKRASYDMVMSFGRMSEPLTKVQKVDSTTTAKSYNFAYKYEDSNHPTAPTQIGHDHYTYDANGNPTLVTNDSANTTREMYWDEDNRLMVLSDNGKTSRYTYNAAGERIMKSYGTMEGVYINGAPQGITFHETDNFTLYPASILSVNKNRFTKHYFIGDKRIASRIGTGMFNNVYGRNGSYVTAGQQDYAERMNQIQTQKEAYYKKVGVAPGVPTEKGAYGDPENTGVGYNAVLTELGNHDVPQGWIQTPRPNTTPNTNPGPPVSWNDPSNPDDPQAGYGYIPNDTTKEETFFYHSDHLGSTSYITDDHANITQYDAYLPYGELLVDEHSSREELPYKFNGKQFDEETGLYYYGARYMNPMASIWYGVDPLAEKYPNVNGYCYTMDNPIKYLDPNGKQSENSIILARNPLGGYYFTPAAAHLLHLVSGVNEQQILYANVIFEETGILNGSIGTAGSSLTAGKDPDHAIITHYYYNFKNNMTYRETNGAFFYEFTERNAHEVGHIPQLKGTRHLVGSVYQYLRNILSGQNWHDGSYSTKEKEADKGAITFRKFSAFIDKNYKKKGLEKLFKNKNNFQDQIIERLDQWWKAFITNKFGKKSESKTKKR